MRDKAAHSHLWIASTSRKSAPHQIESSVSEDCPFFLPNGDLLFRAVEGASNFLYRMKSDGTERHQVSGNAVYDVFSVSPDGRWVIAQTRRPDGEHLYATVALPLAGDSPRIVCLALCWANWDETCNLFYVGFPNIGDKNGYALPLLRTGLPDLPPGGVANIEDLKRMKAVEVIPGATPLKGTPSLYAYARTNTRRNLYRIPLP